MLKAVIVIITIKTGAIGDEYHRYLHRDLDLKSPKLDLQCKISSSCAPSLPLLHFS